MGMDLALYPHERLIVVADDKVYLNPRIFSLKIFNHKNNEAKRNSASVSSFEAFSRIPGLFIEYK